MRDTTVFDCTLIDMDRHHSDDKGNITVVENGKTVPFNVKRAYYLYDVPGGGSRGSHAHKELQQLIIAASGSFDVTLDDGNVKRSCSWYMEGSKQLLCRVSMSCACLREV